MLVLRQVDGNYHIGAHLSHDIYWQIVDHSAIDERHRVEYDRLEAPWNGHACPHIAIETVVGENNLLVSANVEGHTSERDGRATGP